MNLSERVKAALRVTTDDVGIATEIETLIEAAKTELRRLAVVTDELEPGAEVTDPLIERAIILYAKAHFGFGEDQEKYLRLYDQAKGYIVLSYRVSGSHL